MKSAVDTRYAVNEVVAHSGDRMQCLAIASLTDIPLLLGQEAYEKVPVLRQAPRHAFVGPVDKTVPPCAASTVCSEVLPVMGSTLQTQSMKSQTPPKPCAVSVRVRVWLCCLAPGRCDRSG